MMHFDYTLKFTSNFYSDSGGNKPNSKIKELDEYSKTMEKFRSNYKNSY